MHKGHQKLPWTLGKRQLCIPGLCRARSHAWSSAWEEGCSSQPVRYPGDQLSMSRLLYGDCRGQSHLQGMWASTSFFFFLPSLSQTKLASRFVSRSNATSNPCPAKIGGMGGFAEPGVQFCLACCAGCRATPMPHKQAAPRWMLSRKMLCPKYNQHHKRNRLKAYLKLSDHL